MTVTTSNRETLVEYHKMGFKLVPLSSDNKPVVKWNPIYEDPNFWTAEKMEAESKFQNVATVFGKTHIKDSEGRDLYLNGLDCDSESVYRILTTQIEQIRDSGIRSRIESLFSKTEVSAKSLFEYLKQVTCVVKTRKSYGFHIYWLSSRQNNHIRTQDCKEGHEFEVKTDKGSGHSTLPPSSHRSDKGFRYSHKGRTDKIEPIDELYGLFLELFKDCLCILTNGNTHGKSEEIGSSGRKDKERVSATLHDLSEEAIETSIAYLTPYYIKNHRNDFTLPFSGAAWYSKVSEESAAKILEGICTATNDEETDSRLQTLHATYQKALDGEESVTGGPSLADLVSKIKGVDLRRAHKIVDVLKSIWSNDPKLQKEQQHDTSITRELSISQAIREKQGSISVKGQLIGQSSVYNMISAVDIDCDNCGYHNRIDFSEKPIFQSPIKNLHKCPSCDAINFALKLAYEYISTVDIELQDPDKFNEIERLSVRLFEKNTENIIVGEIVTITGNLHV